MEELNHFILTNVTHFIDAIDKAGNWYAYIVPSDNLMMNCRILEKEKYTKLLNSAL